jgi:hypothetical protein
VTNLADLHPPTVGREAVDLVLRRLGRLSVPLSPGVSLDGLRVRGDTDLGLTVASLTAWCQTGALGDWEDNEDAADALLGAAESLCAAPLRDWTPGDLDAAVDLPRGSDPGPVALVLACALDRVRISRGLPVSLAGLARLASVDPSRVRQLVAAGEITAVPGAGPSPSTVDADDACRWLASRGLKGWQTA